MKSLKRLKRTIKNWWNDYQLDRKYKKRLKQIQENDPYNYD